MATSTRACSEMERGTVSGNASTWTALNILESISMISLMEKVSIISRKCIGLYIWKDGERYEGQWQDGKFHGKGIKTLPDGTIFDGDWEEGRPVGQGMCKYPDGAKYTGSWLNG